MNGLESSRPQLFLERIDRYQELADQVVGRVTGESNDPLAGIEISTETISAMSEVEYFKYRAWLMFDQARVSTPEEIGVDLRQASDKFKTFKSIHSALFPDSPITSILDGERPVTSMLESGKFDDLMEQIKAVPLEEDEVRESLELIYLNETGAVEKIRRTSESERQRLVEYSVAEAQNNPLLVRAGLETAVSNGVLGGLVRDGIIQGENPFDEIRVYGSPSLGVPSSFQLMNAIEHRTLDDLGLDCLVKPGQIVLVHEGELKAVGMGHVDLRDVYERNFRGYLEKEPEPISEAMQHFVLHCLRRANATLVEFQEAPLHLVKEALELK